MSIDLKNQYFTMAECAIRKTSVFGHMETRGLRNLRKPAALFESRKEKGNPNQSLMMSKKFGLYPLVPLTVSSSNRPR